LSGELGLAIRAGNLKHSAATEPAGIFSPASPALNPDQGGAGGPGGHLPGTTRSPPSPGEAAAEKGPGLLAPLPLPPAPPPAEMPGGWLPRLLLRNRPKT